MNKFKLVSLAGLGMIALTIPVFAAERSTVADRLMPESRSTQAVEAEVSQKQTIEDITTQIAHEDQKLNEQQKSGVSNTNQAGGGLGAKPTAETKVGELASAPDKPSLGSTSQEQQGTNSNTDPVGLEPATFDSSHIIDGQRQQLLGSLRRGLREKEAEKNKIEKKLDIKKKALAELLVDTDIDALKKSVYSAFDAYEQAEAEYAAIDEDDQEGLDAQKKIVEGLHEVYLKKAATYQAARELIMAIYELDLQIINLQNEINRILADIKKVEEQP